VTPRHYGPAQLAAIERGEVLHADDAQHLALTLAAERVESAREQAATVFALELVAALDAYAATDGRPWAERITARKRVDEARAAVARMEGGR
jgi:hypothetical protein